MAKSLQKGQFHILFLKTKLTVNEIDDESLDVGAVRILIGHDDKVPVSQSLDIVCIVHCAVLQPHDIDKILDLGVVGDILEFAVTHVERLSFQRENSIVVSSYYRQTRHRQRFG